MLAILFGEPQRTFYANEIIGLAATGSGTVQRELARLEGAGLIICRRIGNQKHYQANPGAPIFAELCAIVRKTFGLSSVIRAALTLLSPHIHVAFIYGSIAKGTETARSDIDLLLIGDIPTQAQLLEALAPAQTQLQREINPTLYKPEEFRQRLQTNQTFLLRILNQPKLFIHGSEHDILQLNSAGQSGQHRQAEIGAAG
ncbi:MAG: nucleotidyltransferase domain-containing protein [Sphingomonadaceae bacterium]